MRLLLVEDDSVLGDGLQAGLCQAGFTVDWVQDGRAADLALMAEDFALLILDQGLPGLEGLEILRRLRARGQDLPVLILTARDSTGEKVAGLDAGADDYLIKPIDLDELTARVRALLRRAGGRAVPMLSVGAIQLDPAAHAVLQHGEPVNLSAREFSILQLLLENAGRVLTRSQLEAALYGWGDALESNAVEVHIHHLRKKLGNDCIRTLRGVGYTFPK